MYTFEVILTFVTGEKNLPLSPPLFTTCILELRHSIYRVFMSNIYLEYVKVIIYITQGHSQTVTAGTLVTGAGPQGGLGWGGPGGSPKGPQRSQERGPGTGTGGQRKLQLVS